MQQGGVQAGDVIEAVGGRVVLGQTDWFLARAHFERDEPIELHVRRGHEHLRLWFRIATPNWRTLSGGDIAFQATRPVVLLLAIVLAFARPRQLHAQLVALMFAMIAVAEAFPPAGWAASLHRMPAMLSMPIALASVSWLLITVPWISLSVRFPQRLGVPSWFGWLALAPLIIFVPLMITSAVAVVYSPSTLAMPMPFLDSAAIRLVQSIWGVTPSLFINPWPAYSPARQSFLVVLWVSISMLAFLGGFGILVVNHRRTRATTGKRGTLMVSALATVILVAVHNVVLRNWANLFGTAPPAAFSVMGFVLEAAAFCLLAFTVTRAVLKYR
jgi:hypothetical protein